DRGGSGAFDSSLRASSCSRVVPIPPHRAINVLVFISRISISKRRKNTPVPGKILPSVTPTRPVASAASEHTSQRVRSCRGRGLGGPHSRPARYNQSRPLRGDNHSPHDFDRIANRSPQFHPAYHWTFMTTAP